MSTRPAVLAAIKQVLEDKGLPTDLDDDTVALGEDGLGLDSLDIATVVSLLDEELELDPFADGEVELGSLGQFVALYEQAIDA